MGFVLRALLAAIGFATRVPVRVGALSARELAAALSCLPLVGLGVGAVSAGLAALCAPRLGPQLAALAAVSGSALLTGGLHLDGVADLFDALGGGRGERQRMLEIMRDPRVGAHGASALVLVLAGKLLALAELPGELLWPGLCGAAAAGRLAAVWLLFALPPARTDGLGRGMGEGLRGWHVALASVWLLALAPWLGSLLLTAALASAGVALGLGLYARSRLGGVTGDVCGAAVELCELTFLLVCRAQAVRSGLM